MNKCKHNINWDEPEMIEQNNEQVAFSVGCFECNQEWHIFYRLEDVQRVNDKGEYEVEPDLDFEVFPQ